MAETGGSDYADADATPWGDGAVALTASLPWPKQRWFGVWNMAVIPAKRSGTGSGPVGWEPVPNKLDRLEAGPTRSADLGRDPCGD